MEIGMRLRSLFLLVIAGFLDYIVLFQTVNSLAQSEISIPLREAEAVYTEIPPIIDGLEDTGIWDNATIFDNFIAREPVYGIEPEEPTIVKMLYDDNNIYFYARMYDSRPESIQKKEMKRDGQVRYDDSFVILLDTFHDHRNCFYFATNSNGSRYDSYITDNGRDVNEDWDGIWVCKAGIDSQGWYAEIAIPLRTLRFKEGNTTWGINFNRTFRRTREQSMWLPPSMEYGRGGYYQVQKYGHLNNLYKIGNHSNLFVKPYVLSGYERRYRIGDSEAPKEIGVDIKYGITTNITTDLTYNTDFAQVEADEDVVNLSRFSLYYPEKRDFFLEGAGIFDFGVPRIDRYYRAGKVGRFSQSLRQLSAGQSGNSPFLLFYSRTIGLHNGTNIPILGGAKITGRSGHYSIGLLDIFTDKFSISDSLYSQQTLPQKNYTVARIKRDISDRSNIGVIAYHKGEMGKKYENAAFGIDGNFYWGQYTLITNASKTFTPGLKGDDLQAYAELNYRRQQYYWDVTFLHVGENYNPEMGFLSRKDINHQFYRAGYTPWYPFNWNWMRNIEFNVVTNIFHNNDGNLLTRQLELELVVRPEIGGRFSFNYSNNHELFETDGIIQGNPIPKGTYDFSTYQFFAISDPGNPLNFWGVYEWGGYFHGKKHNTKTFLRYRPNSHLFLDISYSWNSIDFPDDKFTSNVIGTRIIYSFTPDLYVKVFTQWNDLQNRITTNFLLNYIYKPGCDFYLVYNEIYDKFMGKYGADTRTLLVKFTYLF